MIVEQSREQRAAVERLCLEHGTVEAYPVGNYGPAGRLQYLKCADGTAWSLNEDGRCDDVTPNERTA